MTLKHLMKLLSIFVIGFSLSACKNALTSNSNNNGGLDCSDASLCIDPANPIPDVTGKISEGAYSGLEVISINHENQTLVMSIPTPLPFGKAIKKPLKDDNLEDAYIELKQYAPNKWLVQVVIPLKNLVSGKFDPLPSTGLLPTGQPLPGVISGEIPGFAVKWDDGDDKELFLYIGSGMVGIFVPTHNFDPFIHLDIPIEDKRKNLVGWFSTIPETNQYYGGFYMSHLLPSELAKWIDNNLY